MNITSKNIIEMFINGETEAVSGTKSMPGNLKIKNDQIIHYWTPIFERYDGKYILNISRYSLPTGKIQKLIQSMVQEEKYIVVKAVPINYKGKLSDFLK